MILSFDGYLTFDLLHLLLEELIRIGLLILRPLEISWLGEVIHDATLGHCEGFLGHVEQILLRNTPHLSYFLRLLPFELAEQLLDHTNFIKRKGL